MLTIEALRAYGANVDEGLSRCMNNEAFYLRLVGMLRDNSALAQLEAALAAGDVKGAFEHAHALKGVLANLALTPVLTPVSGLTELLRAGRQVNDTSLLAEAKAQMEKLQALL